MEIQLEEWLTRVDESDDTFLAELTDYTLDNWDHYTHLRIAFVLLTRYGRREGMKLIFEGIKKFIENSPRTRRGGASNEMGENTRGTTFHETMTYFWVHMVHYAIESTKITAAATGNQPHINQNTCISDLLRMHQRLYSPFLTPY